MAALKAHRRELIDPKIVEHAGRIVKTTGDGLLLEFGSVVDAVRCAVDVQRGMNERNEAVPANQRLEFRVGINVGDIIIDGDDIFGDGVNVASRLEALAEPGGICVSRVVRDQVLDKLRFTFKDLGAQHVKNIAQPVQQTRGDDDPGPFVTRLVVQVKGALLAAERRRILAEPLDRASADDLTWRADALRDSNPDSIDALAQANKLYDRALKLDPNLTSALMGKTLGLGMLLEVDPAVDRDRVIREYADMSARLVAVAGREARAWNIRADALQDAWRWEGALEANARAQKIDPSRVGSIGQRPTSWSPWGVPKKRWRSSTRACRCSRRLHRTPHT